MKEIGVSVYPDLSPIEEIEAYLELASRYGCTRVFSSMFSMDGSKEEILSYFRRLIETAHRFRIRVSLDVNPQFLTKIGASYDDLSLFHDIGCDILRLDLSYGKEKDLIAIQNPYGIQIQLNASGSAVEEVSYLKENGITDKQLLLGHNFYPQRYTGLKWKSYLAINETLSPFGYPIEAFVSSHAEHTHGVWDARDGLPTVEMMRDLPIDLQARLLFSSGCEKVLIGNAYASEAELKALQETVAPLRIIDDSPLYEILQTFGGLDACREEKQIRIKPAADLTAEESFYLFDCFPHLDIGDSSEWIWRSRMGRFLNKEHPVKPKDYALQEFPVGSVLIVNDRYKHYAGEVQIARRPIKNDGTRNLAAVIDENEMIMLDVIHDLDVITFLK